MGAHHLLSWHYLAEELRCRPRKLALDADEERDLELKRETTGGQERMAWNADLSLPSKEFEFSDSEAARIRGAIQTWESYVAGSDRRWLQPLRRYSRRELTRVNCRRLRERQRSAPWGQPPTTLTW